MGGEGGDLAGPVTHGSKALDEDAAKLIALGQDPGPTIEDLERAAARADPRQTSLLKGLPEITEEQRLALEAQECALIPAAQHQLQAAANPTPEDFYALDALRELVRAQRGLIEALEGRVRIQEDIIMRKQWV